ANRGLARRILTTRAGRLLAPGSLEADAVHVSWTGPTRIDGVVLRDEQGARLVAAPRAVVDWNLWQILFAPRDSLTLEIPGAEVEIERRPDGRIDLYETLKPVIRDEPDLRLTVNIAGGRLRFKDAALAEPFAADRAEIRLDVPPDPKPVEWDIRLDSPRVDGADADGPGRIGFKGSVHRPGQGGATISLAVTGWPLALAAAGSVTRGRVDAALSANRQEDRWTLSASANGSERRPAAPGEQSAKDRTVTARVEAQGQSGNWFFSTLGLAIPYARLDGSGTVRSTEGTSGLQLDLKGSLAPDWKAIQADLRRDVEPGARIAGRAREWRVSGTLGGPDSGNRLAALAAEAGIQLELIDVYGMRLGPTGVVLRTEGGPLRVDPIDSSLNDGVLHLEPELVQAEDGPWRLKLGHASTLRDAVINDEVSHRVLSYAAPVLDGATRVQGRVSVRGLDAEIPLAAGERGPAARARVEGDVLFDDVRFLPGPLADSILELLPNRGEEPRGGPMLVLRDPISFRIAEGRVNTKGLLLPVAQLGTVGLEGSVDFQKRLDLVARFRVNPPRQDRPVLAALLNNARFELPITGTLDAPKIDRDALKERMKSIGSDMIDGSIEAGAIGLFRLLEGLPRRREARKPLLDGGGFPSLSPSPRAEANPPPRPDRPTAEERKQRREERRQERAEKKAQRRMRRGEPLE
ncbi:MAG: AsmA family protein, partial [Isosphaeraceae bacterium]